MKTIAALILFLTAPLGWAYEVSCTGYDSRTSAFVTGTCTDGTFSGNDTRTGSFVTGSCTAGGEFTGYDTRTDSWVTGNCDSDNDDRRLE